MSVQISELDVVPRPGEGPQELPVGQQQQGGGAAQQSSSPQQEHEVARALALLAARDLRLRAD